MRVFLDTTALIDMLDGEKGALDKIEELRRESVLFTSSINLYETLRGIMDLHSGHEKHLKALEAVTANIAVLDIDAEVARKAAGIYKELRGRGKPINEPDYLIAGACTANGIEIIMTRNRRHFENIRGIKTIIGY